MIMIYFQCVPVLLISYENVIGKLDILFEQKQCYNEATKYRYAHNFGNL